MTTKAKPAAVHTPGPWHVATEYDGKPVIDLEGRMFVLSESGTIVARVGQVTVPTNAFLRVPEEDDNPHQLANARLIAAAPQLLDALQRMLFLHGPRNAEEQQAEREAREALALATGETQC